MRAGQEFIDFPIDDLSIHLERVTKPPERAGQKRLLRVPLIVRYGGRVLLQDMRNTLAVVDSNPSINACINLPYLTFTPEQIRAAKFDFTKLVAGGVFEPKKIVQVQAEERQKAERTIRPLLVYKDYPLTRIEEETTITSLPARIEFSRKKPEPAILRDFRKIHGETEWVDIEDAVRRLAEQTEAEPGNNIALDASAVVGLASVRVFNVPLADRVAA